MAVYLVRHTAPNITPGIIYAATSVRVHDGEFKRIIPLHDASLPERALIVTSPLTRCRRRADFLAMGGNERIVILDPRFIERDLGRWTGKNGRTFPALRRKNLRRIFLITGSPCRCDAA